MDQEPTAEERTAIILEDINGKFTAIQEGQEAIEKRLTHKIESESKKLNEKIDFVQLQVKAVKKDVEEIKSELRPIKSVLSDHEHRIKKLEAI